MICAANAANFNRSMMSSNKEEFYTYATKKLRKGSYKAFGDTKSEQRSGSTVYTLHDDEVDASIQYPMGALTNTQEKYMNSFLRGITGHTEVSLDINSRHIHTIGVWVLEEPHITVSCTLLQPNITTASTHLRYSNIDSIMEHIKTKFPSSEHGQPSVKRPKRNVQMFGRFTIPLADSLLEHGILRQDQISCSNIVLSNTQPIFVVVADDGVYECRLTHTSCSMMMKTCPANVGISPATQSSQNYSFRSRDITEGTGTGPTITIHRSGTLQYQGKPDTTYAVGSCFKECIMSIMLSKHASQFINSLCIIRDLSAGDMG